MVAMLEIQLARPRSRSELVRLTRCDICCVGLLAKCHPSHTISTSLCIQFKRDIKMTISTKLQPAVAIVGAGIGGLALALFLRRAGITTITIFELRPRNADDGGYLALAPNALYQLDQLDLYQQLVKQGYGYEELSIFSNRYNGTSHIGQVLNGSREKYGYPALRVSRHVVRETLLEAVDRDPLIEVRFGNKVVDVYESTDFNDVEEKVILMFEDGYSQPFDYVIGADGIHSRIRSAVTDQEPEFVGQVGIGGGCIPRSSLPTAHPLPCLLMGRTNGFMMMPTVPDGSLVSTFATVESEARTRKEWATLSNNKAELAKMLLDGHCSQGSEWGATVQQICRQSASPEQRHNLSIWPHFQLSGLDWWTSESCRIICIGDSVHAMPPSGGQGAAMALEDAASLARVFAKVLDSDSEDFTADFQEEVSLWEERRQDRCAHIQAFATKSGNMRRSTPSRAQQIVKESFMWAALMIRGKTSGFEWIYGHREKGPKIFEDIESVLSSSSACANDL